MDKVSEYLAQIIGHVETIGVDAEQVVTRFAGDVEGHLRVAEAHLQAIVNELLRDAAPAPTEQPDPDETSDGTAPADDTGEDGEAEPEQADDAETDDATEVASDATPSRAAGSPSRRRQRR